MSKNGELLNILINYVDNIKSPLMHPWHLANLQNNPGTFHSCGHNTLFVEDYM